jgi:NAD(P)-dependent dehydrogenase (short-subunit alcohol dehydrogenase family)
VFVTGGTTGIGLEACKQLAAQGMDVILTSRTEAKGKVAVAQVQAVAKDDGVHVDFLVMELSKLSSVAQACELLQEKIIDYVILNAGIMMSDQKERQESEDGIELTVAVNHVAGFYLAHKLIPVLEKTSKVFPLAAANSSKPMITFVSSDLHNIHSPTGAAKSIKPIVEDDLVRFLSKKGVQGIDGSAVMQLPTKDPTHLTFDPTWSYKYSKLLNVLSTQALHERLVQKDKSSLGCNSMEPGFIPESDLSRGPKKLMGSTVSSMFVYLLYHGPTNWFLQWFIGQPVRTLQEGGYSEVYACTKGTSGTYYRLDLEDPPSPLTLESDVVQSFYSNTVALLKEKGYPVERV